MIKSYNIYLTTTKEQELVLDSQSKICNWLYNQLLDYVKNNKITKYSLRNYVFEIIKINPFVKTVFSSCYKNVALRLFDALKRFWSHQNQFPNYKSWKRKWFSLYYDEAKTKGIKVNNNILTLSLGKDKLNKNTKLKLKLKTNLPKEFKYKTARICKDYKGYYITFTSEEIKEPAKKEIIKTCALDPNHKNLVQLLDDSGTSIIFNNVKHIKYFNQRIDELTSLRDKCKPSSKKDKNGKNLKSKKWNVYNQAIIKARNSLREQNKQALYSLSHYLVKNYDEIIIGDYDPSIQAQAFGEKAHKSHRTMFNNSLIGQLRKVLSWVSLKSGKVCSAVDESYTTRMCSCGKINNNLTPDDREWTCEFCEKKHVRDELSCYNMMMRYSSKKENTLRCSRLYLGEDLNRWTSYFDYRRGGWDMRELNTIYDEIESS